MLTKFKEMKTNENKSGSTGREAGAQGHPRNLNGIDDILF